MTQSAKDRGDGTPHRIAVLPGDGVGPELIAQAMRLLERVAELDGVTYEATELPYSARHYRSSGVLLDDDGLSVLRAADALLVGAFGVPDLPGVMERALLIDVTRILDLSRMVRPVYLHHERLTPLKGLRAGDIDLVIVWDNTEGEMVVRGGSVRAGTEHEAAVSPVILTRQGVEQTVRYGFELAMRRRMKLTVISQYNALSAHEIFPKAVSALEPQFPDVALEHLHSDAGAMRFVLDPGSLDVVVTSAMIGNMLTDLGAATIGGIGLVGSGRINPATGRGLFEPAHGSAPRYQGRNVVSPLATFKGLSMLLDSVGEKAPAQRIESAIDRVLRSGAVPDATTRSGMRTAEVTDAVLDALT